MNGHLEISADDPRVLQVAKRVHAIQQEEATAGFPTLGQIPSTGVIKILDYFDALSADERAAQLEAQARIGALMFFPPPLIARAHEQLRTSGPALLRRAAALQAPAFSYGLRYVDLRMHRATINDAQSMAHMAQVRSGLDFTPRDDLPEALVGRTNIRDIVTAKAPLLRKLLNPMLLNLLGARPIKRPGGDLVYEGMISGVPLKVSIIFSNMYGQMHYAVSWSMRERQLMVFRLSYENLFGANGGWDYLTEENAPRSIELLGGLLQSLANLFQRVAAAATPRSSGLE